MIFKSLGQLKDLAANRGPKKLIVAVAQDDDVLKAVDAAFREGLITPVLVGNKEKIKETADRTSINISNFEIIDEPVIQNACIRSVGMIRSGSGEILMKGMVSTSTLLKTILDKENGLLTGGLLSHLAFFESPHYHKIFCITDAALNILPNFEEKVAIVKNAVDSIHRLGNKNPKIAVLAPVETVNSKIEATVHGAMLTQMQKRNQICGCIIDGPLALDNAISKQAAQHKGIISDVAGDADVLLAPDLNSGNILYKSLSFLGNSVCAAIVAGASVPIVLTSRADQDKSKYLSIALAVAIA